MLTAVTGINWGDEGKGRVIDLLAENADIVARYQGGNNAGHTVVTEKGKFILNLLPSGILHPEVTCVLGTGMVVIGLASLIIGETLFGRGGMWVKAAAAVAGSVIYRFIIALALRANVPSECLKLISAVIVALAIAAPALKKNLALRRRRAVSQKGGKTHA